jgi:hypothetical protein
VIHTNCSHLLRYIAVVSIVERKTKEVKELVRMLNKKNTIYRDNAILNFLEELYVNVDIDKSISKLEECEKELKNDFFLNSFAGLVFLVFKTLLESFLNNSKQLIFESNCRIYKRTDISKFVEKLKIKQNPEEWVKEVIQKSQLNATISGGKVETQLTPQAMF